MNQDFLDFLQCLTDSGARFLVVGAHAMAVHGVPRATGDIDVWIDASAGNAARIWEAIRRFGAPAESLGITPVDLQAPGRVLQFGLPPARIDVLTSLTGVEFEGAWSRRQLHAVGPLRVPFLGRADLIANKRATGRTKDIADLEILEG